MESVLFPLLLVDHSLLSFNSPWRFDNLTIMLYLLFVLPVAILLVTLPTPLKILSLTHSLPLNVVVCPQFG